MSIPVTKKNCKIGMKVVRGKDWKWADQDCDCDGKQTIGEIISDGSFDKWIRVRWSTEYKNCYRIGCDDCYDLYVYNPICQIELDFGE